jgi:aminopeptidase
MLTRIQLERYADVLLWGLKTARTKTFKKNDVIFIRYHLPAVKLAEILFERLLDMGMNPIQRMDLTPSMEHSFYNKSNDRQLVFMAPGEELLYESLNGSIFLHAPESITHLSGVDPRKIGRTAVSRKCLRDIFTRREEQGLFGWTLCSYPTDELAKHADMPLKAYVDQITRACFLNKKSPVEEWKSIFREAVSIKKWLNSMDVKHYHVESAHVDLEITPGDMRKWIGISGHNIPSFELFISPDWRGTKGVYYADQPSYRSGNYVEGVRLMFQKGKAVRIEAAKGEDFLIKQLSMDKGANRVGEFSLTDKRFSKIDKFMANTLFDENFGGKFGNCHIAVGSSYSDTYKNDPGDLTGELKEKLGFNDSALHWDLVNTEKKRVVAHLKDGKIASIYESGKFLY